jgi:hypothetical protein
MIEGVEFSGFHSKVWLAGLEVNRKRFIRYPSASDLTRKYRVFRKKLSFPQTLESDINHIISKQNAAESIYPQDSNQLQGPEGVEIASPPGGSFPRAYTDRLLIPASASNSATGFLPARDHDQQCSVDLRFSGILCRR